MQKLLLFTFILAFSIKSFGQNNSFVDRQLDSIQDVHEQIKFLNDWTGTNYRKHPNEALFYSEKCFELAIACKNYSGAGDALNRLGLFAKRKSSYKEALNYYTRAIDIYKLTDDSTGINKTLFNRAIVYSKTGNLNQALKDYLGCAIFFENQNDTKALSSIYNSIGVVYKRLKNYNKALYYYRKSSGISTEYNLNSSLYLSNTNIANIYSIQNKFQEALCYHKKNLDVLKAKPNKYRLAQTYHNIGACLLLMKQYAMAIDYHKQSLNLKEKIGNKSLIITSLNGLSHSYYMTNNLDKALSYSKRAYQLGKEVGNIELQENSSKEIFKIYTHKHLSDSAISYFDIHDQLRDSILNTEILKQVSEIQAKYEAEKKEAQIALLKKENNNKAMQRNGLVVILILIAAYAGFIVYSYYSNKKLTRLLRLQKSRIEWSKELLDCRNKELKVSNQTKNKLFQIISHDLRSPLASVSGISHLIQILLKQGRYHELDETSQDLNECVTRVLNLTDNLLSWSLNQSGKLPFTPVVIPVKNLLSGILKIYKAGAQQKNILLELSISQNLFVYADRPMLETVVRNLLNNALKFTPEGGLIVLGAEMKEDYTEIYIEDNGVGISDEAISHIFELDTTSSGTRGEKGNGLGLILCKDFIERNHGKIWVESREGHGTTFRFTVPNAEKIFIEESISHQ
ncbi:tetratricopeptide repeat-containing sensor histidine kinase [Marinifilum sp. D737]|uniref:tetratricopeptide repeat-containing sensor histidine kinase n=1 Tax=Marinifilum sp. D737 TaxID=2969628 RepID=UPI002272BED0|nr:tetratricopeptide repeat protein [Marinifilum sp. D737]MCY1636181.1 tetratricopeptide repeat protein [Marinifilum sp. D737]